jgi:hypothetical protein
LHLPTTTGRGLAFDDRYSSSGGEDQIFFRTARALGLEIRYSADALVTEAVPSGRANLHYLLQRELRKGDTLGLLAAHHRELGEGRLRRLAAACKWMAMGVAHVASAGPLWFGDRTRARALAARGVLESNRAAGMIGGLLGWRYELYARRLPPVGPGL